MALVNRYSAIKQAVITSTGNTMVLCASTGRNSGNLTRPNGGTTRNWTLDGSSAQLSILANSTILYAELIWYTSVFSSGGPDLTGVQDVAISFTTPDLVVHSIPVQTAQNSVVGTHIRRFRSNSTNIKPLIQANGSGQYTVSRVPASICPSCTGDNTRAGWQLIVVYENLTFPFRSLTVYTGVQAFNNGNPISVTLTGFSTPPTGIVGGRLLLCAADGDPDITGESFSAGPTAGTLVPLGNPVTTPNANPGTSPNNPRNNIFAGQINIADPLNPNVGLLNTSGTFGTVNHNAFVPIIVAGARNKWDITNLDLTSALTTNQTQLVVAASVAGNMGAVEIQSMGIQVDVNSAKLTATKTVSATTANVGDTLTYTINFTNTGTTNANNVVITDLLPNGVTYLPASLSITGDTAASVTGPNPLVITLANPVPSGATRIVTFNVTVSAIPTPNPISNAATIDYDFIPTGGATPVDGSVTTSPTAGTFINNADLVLTKTDSPDPVLAGNTLTYTLTVTNNGPSTADTVQLTDTVPTCIPSPTFTVGGVPQGAWTGTYNIGNMASGTSRQIVISGTVNPACPTGPISNTATVTSPTADPTPANRTATITTQVNTSADLSITKTDSPDPVIAGQTLTYTITVNNTGPSNAQTVQLTDTLPTCLTGVTYRVNPGAYAPWPGGAIALGTIAPATSVVVDIQGIVNPSCLGSISNTASVTSPTPDPTPANRTTTISTQVNGSANLVLTKTDLPDPVIAGQTLTYTLTLVNNGPSDAQTVQLTDIVPTCVTSPQFSVGGGPWAAWTGGPYALGTVANGATVTVQIRGIIDPGCAAGTITNTATVTSPTPDPIPGTRTATQSTTVNVLAGLVVTKTDSPDPVLAGNTLTYTLAIKNNGPSHATTVQLTDAVDACVTSPQFSVDGGPWGSWTGAYAIGTLNSGATVTVQIRGAIQSGCLGSINNTATVTSPTPDPTPANRTTTIATQIDALASLRVIKTDNPDPVLAGNTLAYTLVVTNSGPSDATTVQLTDVVPTCLLSPTYTLGGVPQGAWTGAHNIGTMTPGASLQFVISGAIDHGCATGPITNTATLTSPTPDSTPANRTDTITTQVNTSADLVITKSDTPDPVIAGQTLTYTLTVTNNGPSDAQAVQLTDAVPACLPASTFTLDGTPMGAWTGGPYTLGMMLPGASRQVVITGIVNSSCLGSMSNTASVTSPTPDPTPTNRTSTVSTQINGSANLVLTKTDLPDPVIAGQTLTYTLTLVNNGPSDAQTVQLTDSVPTCVTSPQFSVGGGPWAAWTGGPYALGNVANGATVTVQIRGIVDPGCLGTITNTATVTSPTPDPIPGTRTATQSTTVNASAGLVVTKTDSPDPVIAGQTLTYTLTVKNNGPSHATTVQLTDAVNACVTSPQFSVGGGAWNTWTGAYSIGTLNSGVTVTLQIRGIIQSGCLGSINNTATVTSPTPDPTPANRTTTIATQINALAALRVTKTDNPDPVLAGNTLTYTLVVTNSGPSDATTVQLTDAVPTCLLMPTYTVGGVPQGAWGGSHNIGTMTPGASLQFVISGTIDHGCWVGPISNTATVTSPTPDPTPANRTSTITTQVNTSADIVIAKTDAPDPVIAGQTLTYTLTVTNNGPSDAQAVQVSDTVPACLNTPTFTVDGTPIGAWTGGPYPLGMMVPGASRQVVITGIINPGCLGTISNTATITSPTPAPIPGNRTSTTSTQIDALANLVVIKTDTPDPVTAGELLTYDVTITNNGPSDATTVNLTDVVPTCVTNPEFSIDGGPWNAWSGGPYPLGTIESSDTVTVRIKGIVAPGCTGSIDNTATVTSPTPDPTPATRTTTIDTQVNGLANLVITKTDSPDPVIAGEMLTYTLTITNNGPANAQAVDLTDAVDACVTSPEYSTDGFNWYAWDGGPYALGNIARGATVTIRIRGIVDPACLLPIMNTATVSSITPDPTPATRTTTIDTQVDTRARLSITKTDNPDPVIAGEMLTYTLTIANSGPSDAQTVALTDMVDACVTSPEYQVAGGGWNPWSGGPEPLGTMVPGDTITVEVRGTIDPICVGTINNTATVTSPTPDPTPSNRTTTINTEIETRADLKITKSDSPDPVVAGEILTYTLAVINNGPSDAIEVNLNDEVPACVTEPEYSTDGGANWNPWTGTLSLGRLAPTATAEITLRGKVDPNCLDTITNIATVESPTPPLDPNDRTTSQTTTVEALADLAITKTANPDPVPTEGILTYTIVITNAGPSTAVNTALLDSLSTCLLDAVYSLDAITWQPWTGVLPLGNITPTMTITVFIRGKVAAECTGAITNTASIASPTPPGASPNRITTINTPVTSLANIAVDITTKANVSVVTLDDVIIYTTTLLNTGGTNALNVVFKDYLSPATAFIPDSVMVNGVLVNNADITRGVNVGTIPPGEQAVVQYAVRVVSGVSNGEIKNEALANFYQVIHTKRCCPAETKHVFALVKVTVINFKQLSLNHSLKLASKQPDIEAIDESTSEIIIKDYYVVNVPKSTSIEGQRLSGYKLVIHGVLKVAINYTAALVDQSMYAAEWMMPFSTFIMLPADYEPGQLFEVAAVIENTETIQMSGRMIDVDVTVYMGARKM